MADEPTDEIEKFKKDIPVNRVKFTGEYKADDPTHKFRKSGYEALDRLPILNQMIGSGGQHYYTTVRGTVRKLHIDANGEIKGFYLTPQDASGAAGKDLFIRLDPSSQQGVGLMGRHAKVAWFTGWHSEFVLSKQIYDDKGDYYCNYVQQHNRDAPVYWYGKNNKGELGIHQVKYGSLEDPLNTKQDNFQRLMADRMASQLFREIEPSFDSHKLVRNLLEAKFSYDDAVGNESKLPLDKVFIKRYRASNLISDTDAASYKREQADIKAGREPRKSMLGRIPPPPAEFVSSPFADPKDIEQARIIHEKDAAEYRQKFEKAFDNKLTEKFEYYLGNTKGVAKKTFKEILSGKLSTGALKAEDGTDLYVQQPVLDEEGLPKLENGQVVMTSVLVDRLTHNLLFDDDQQGFNPDKDKASGKINPQLERRMKVALKEKLEAARNDQEKALIEVTYKKAFKDIENQNKTNRMAIGTALQSDVNEEQRLEYLVNRTALEAFSTQIANVSKQTFKTNGSDIDKSVAQNTNEVVQKEIDLLLRADPKLNGSIYGADKDLATLCDDMLIAKGILLPNTIGDDSPQTPGKKTGSVASHTSLRLVKEAVDRALNEAQEFYSSEDVVGPDGKAKTLKPEERYLNTHHTAELPNCMSNGKDNHCDRLDKAMDEMYKGAGAPSTLEEALKRRIDATDQKVAPKLIAEINDLMDRIKTINGVPRRGEMDPVSAQAAWAAFLEGLAHGTKGLKELLTELESGYGLIDLGSK